MIRSSNITFSIHAACAEVLVEGVADTHWVRVTFETGQEVTVFAPTVELANEFADVARKLWPVPPPAAAIEMSNDPLDAEIPF